MLFSVAEISKKFYPNADIDFPDQSLQETGEINLKFKSVTFGKNIFLGKNVKIGSNTIVGSNTVIEHDVQINKNCVIGANVTIRNSIIGLSLIHISEPTRPY